MQYTLIIDGNYFLRRLHGASGLTFMEDPDGDTKTLITSLAQSFSSILKQHKDYINNVIMVVDYSSWRKSYKQVLPVESVSDDETKDVYKANRKNSKDVDWTKVYETFNTFCENLVDKFKVSVIKSKGAEGDDSIYVITRLLSNNNIKSIIWSVDGDFIQLVSNNILYCRKTKDENLYICKEDFDKLESKHAIFESNPNYINSIINNIRGGRCYKNGLYDVFIKIIRADKKDNVGPIFTWKPNIKNLKPTIKHIEKALESLSITKEDITIKHLYDDIFISNFITKLLKITKQTRDLEHTINVFKSNRKMLVLSDKEIPHEIIEGIISECKIHLKTKPNIDNMLSYRDITDSMGVNENNSYFDQFNL